MKLKLHKIIRYSWFRRAPWIEFAHSALCFSFHSKWMSAGFFLFTAFIRFLAMVSGFNSISLFLLFIYVAWLMVLCVYVCFLFLFFFYFFVKLKYKIIIFSQGEFWSYEEPTQCCGWSCWQYRRHSVKDNSGLCFFVS